MKFSFPFSNLPGYACAALLIAVLGGAVAGWAQGSPCEVSGRIVSGGVPLPGVTVSVSNPQTGSKSATSTDVNGTYSVGVAASGRYTVRAELSGFAAATKEVAVGAENCHARVELAMKLLSRAQAAERRPQGAPQRGNAGMNRGFQNLALAAVMNQMGGEAQTGGDNPAGDNADPSAAAAAGINPESATETVAVSGNAGQTNDMLFGGNNEEMRQRIEEMRERARQNGGQFGGGPGGYHGGPGPGGGGPMIMMGGRGRFNINRPHGSLFYSAANSALDAAPYSLTGQPTVKPDYMQQRFGGAIGGPLKIPHIYNGATKTFFFITYFGNRAQNPYDVFSTVPTLAERAGDFSQTLVRGQPVQIFDPYTHLPFANSQIPQAMINPAAQGLLAYIPKPNLPGDAENFHYTTSADNSSDNLNLRLMHNFGEPMPGPFGMGGFGRRGGGRPRNNINFGVHWQRSNSVQTNPMPSVSGVSKAANWDVPAGWIYGRGKLTNMLRFDFNRSHMATSNLYAYADNIVGQLGIAGVSQNPFDWGLPGLSFTNFAGLSDTTPLARVNQTWSLSDTVIWNHGKHTVRFGGDFRRIHLDTRTDKNSRGSFIFTGLYTSDGAPGAGFDLADFLLGLPQQASVQYGATSYHFAANSWDLFVQDNWQVRGNLTVNIGLRYEYVSPYSEENNQIVNLDAAPGFTAVAPVCAAIVTLPSGAACSSSGPYSGVFPSTLISPDRNNFAPRIGLAWKPMARTVVRAGYGVNYNTTQYAAMAQNLAFQPPFAFTETNIGGATSPLPLQNAFPALASTGEITNNYGVDRKYRLGYVQIWSLDVQRELTRSLLLNVTYNGSKGTHLDILRAPNRGPGGLLLAGVQAFLWESSDGDSILHSGTVRLRKRMAGGLSLGGSYTFSKSIDNASSIGGGATVVAQNDLDLAAERGLSSFDQRHRISADYTYEFPFGANKRWLAAGGWAERLFGDWQWSGNFTINSGTPFTARVLGDFTDIARGTSGTLRADVTGQPIALSGPSIAEWFNTAAFTLPPPGQFGNAGRNTIIGPRTTNFNMALAKTIALGEARFLELRLQGNNVFNTPQYTAIDTTVNSRTFGRVISAGAMRRMQVVARLRF